MLTFALCCALSAFRPSFHAYSRAGTCLPESGHNRQSSPNFGLDLVDMEFEPSVPKLGRTSTNARPLVVVVEVPPPCLEFCMLVERALSDRAHLGHPMEPRFMLVGLLQSTSLVRPLDRRSERTPQLLEKRDA